MSRIMNVPDDNQATNFACLRPFIPQIFKDFHYVISSGWQAIAQKQLELP